MNKLFYLLSVLFLVSDWAFADVQSLPQACVQECVTTFGKVTGESPSGVTAYSNCKSECVNPEPNFKDGVYTGIKWQCVEYARRWLLTNKDVVYGDVDIAADIWDLQSVHSPDKDSTYPFVSILNGAENASLQRGDLLIYAAAFLGTGHVAVILAVDEAQQKVIVGEQNFANKIWQEKSAREVEYIIRDQQLWLLDPYLIGWKRVTK